MMGNIGAYATQGCRDGGCRSTPIAPPALAEVHRILRPGGVFFVSSMVAPPKSDDARACFEADRGWLLRDGKPYRTLKSLDDLASELSHAGFAVEEHSLGINPWWDHAMMVCRKPRA